jgi:hypothetical protein
MRVIIGMLAMVALLPTQASATVRFGANLNQVPSDKMVDCTTLPPWGVPTFASSCTWYSNVSETESDIVPLGVGVITHAKVRVGASTGPMQFVIGRAQVDKNKEIGHQLLCCVWRAAGPVFTPAPNAVTDVTLNTPVQRVTDFESKQDLFDNLALSVLAPGVPIPAAPVGPGALNITSTAGACWPAVQQGNSYCMPGGPGRYVVLFNADWEYNPTGPRGNPAVNLAKEFAWVRRNAARVVLSCLLAKCDGQLQLQNAKAPGAAAAAARRTVTYGTARFAIAAGKTKTVVVKLNAAGRALFTKEKRARVWANSVLGSGASRQVRSAKLTLRR